MNGVLQSIRVLCWKASEGAAAREWPNARDRDSSRLALRVPRRRHLIGVALLLFYISLATSANERVALVIGNAAYEHVPPLVNPRNDAEDMAGLLRRLGFVVTEGLDLTDVAMKDRIRTFARRARGAEVALVFYAGHGMQVGGVNYLLPVDARLADELDLDFEAVALDLVLRSMGTWTNLVFLDACRDNPVLPRLGRGGAFLGGKGPQAGGGRKCQRHVHCLRHRPGQRRGGWGKPQLAVHGSAQASHRDAWVRGEQPAHGGAQDSAGEHR